MKRIAACLVSVVLAAALVPLPSGAGVARAAESATSSLAPQPSDVVLQAQGASGGLSGKRAATTARPDISISDGYSMRSVGIGGHGAVFDPVISPFDHDTFIASCDMGGVYVTHDAGCNWDLKNCGGRIWDIQADPSTSGTFYACGSGLWRSTDNGDTWSLMWPDPKTVKYTPTKLNHTRTYYISTDSFPNQHAVETMRVDPDDPKHLVALAAMAANAADTGSESYYRRVFESFDGGESFRCIAQYKRTRTFERNFEHGHLFIEHGRSSAASRVVLVDPSGVYEVDRAAAGPIQALVPLHENAQGIVDVQQVVDRAGTHYVVLESATEAEAKEMRSRVRLWHTTDFADDSKRVDLTDEFVASLPRHYNSKFDRTGDENEITMHNAVALAAPSLDRIYLSYRTSDYEGPTSTTWQGICGLVSYDSSREAGEKFRWEFGLRLWWDREDAGKRITPDQNCIMARGHCDSSYAYFDVAVDPRNDRAIALPNHTGLMYSPDIDADVGKLQSWQERVNIYPCYATYVASNPKNPTAPGEGFMRSTGLEVTVAQHVAIDPYDPDHIIVGYDDAGLGQSFDGGETWTNRRSAMPKDIYDTCFDAVFDEGKPGVVYGVWSARGGSAFNPEAAFMTAKACFALSEDGGDTWSAVAADGLPETANGVRLAVVCPRDAEGNITDGERTIYLATMGYGFYVSRDSGRSFEPMNAGIPFNSFTVKKTVDGVTTETPYDAIWARDVLVTEDGRVFGITQYSQLTSSTRYLEQDPDTFGNVWEWDAAADGGAGRWARLPLNEKTSVSYKSSLQVRQPRALSYDAGSRTLYVAAVSCVGNYPVDPEAGTYWENFGGGLYAYSSEEGAAVGSGEARPVDEVNGLVGPSRSLTGIGFDADGAMWVATEDGDVWCDGDAGWEQVCSNVFCLCQGFDMAPDGTVYLTTRGAGSFRIDKRTRLSGTTLKLKCGSVAYSGKAQKPTVTLKHGSTTLKEKTHYTLSYLRNGKPTDDFTNVGAIIVKATAVSGSAYKGTLSAQYKITSKKVTPTVALSTTRYVYNGKAQKPAVSVWADSKKKTKLSSKAYTVTWKNNKTPGKATATVKLAGNYSGSKSATFTIVPKGTSLVRVASARKALTATWKKQATQVTGYELHYSTSKNFKKGVKKVVVKGAKATSKKLAKLAPKKKYYLRVRTFKTVSGKSYSSAWSKVKAATTKK